MTFSLVENVATAVAAAAALTAVLAFFGGITRSARLRRQIEQLTAWQAAETHPDRRRTLRQLLITRQGELLARQLTPLSAIMFPAVGFLILAGAGVQDMYSIVNYARGTGSFSWGGWFAETFYSLSDFISYAATLGFLLAPIPYMSLRHTLYGRQRAMLDYRAALPVAAPELLILPGEGRHQQEKYGWAWLSAYAAGIGTYLTAAGVLFLILVRSLSDDLPEATLVTIGGVTSLAATAGLGLLFFGAYMPLSTHLKLRKPLGRYPTSTLHIVDKHWTPQSKD